MRRITGVLGMLALSACGPSDVARVNLLDEFDFAEVAEATRLIDFGTPEARANLDTGWSRQDERWAGNWSFVWGVGERSVARFQVVGAAPRAIRFHARPAVLGQNAAQRVEVTINAEHVGDVTLGEGLNGYRLVVPDSVFVQGENVIEFGYSGHAPASRADRRRRAVAWDRLRFVGPTDSDEISATDAATRQADGLQLRGGVRVNYAIDAMPEAAVTVQATAGWNHPESVVSVDAVSVGGQSVSRLVSARELVDGFTVNLPGPGVMLLSLGVANDPDGRGVRISSAYVDAANAAQLAPATGRPNAGAVPEFPDRSNILVYLVDTLRADHLGAYGYAKNTSPELDAIAADGVVFDRMIAQSSWTRTSVASLFTGLFPRSHGIMGRNDALPDEAHTLAEVLGDIGYSTYGVTTNGNVSATFGFEQGFDEYNYLPEADEALNPEVHQLADRVNEEFLGWLDARADEQVPFFAYLHTTDPHAPYTPREPFAERFVGESRFDLVWPRFAAGFVAENPGTSREEVVDELEARYDAEVAFNDLQFGDLVRALESRGLLEDTIVVFTSDHGEEFLEHDDIGHGRTLYREQIHVPLVVRLPGGAGAGSRVAGVVQHADLLPTLVALAGEAPPAWAQGVSFAPALLDSEWDAELGARSFLELDGVSAASLVAGDWHLQRAPANLEGGLSPALEMFDWRADVEEGVNLRPGNQVLAAWLLAGWRRSDAADLPLFGVAAAEIDEELAARLRDLGYIR